VVEREHRSDMKVISLGMLAAVVLTACATVGAGGGSGGAYGARDMRQLVGSYADVRAVAVSRRYVYSATPSGIGVYDRIFNSWLAPLARDNGVAEGQVTAMSGDPVEDAVWYGVPGAVIAYRPQVEQLQRTMIVGVPDIIAFEKSATGDVVVRAGGAWTRVSRTGLATPMAQPPSAASLILPPTLDNLYTQFPMLRAQQSSLFREQRADRSLLNFRIVAGVSSPERASEVWLATNGDGLYRVDPTLVNATPLRFGPIESGIGALALAADGVWSAGLGVSRVRSGLSFARDDMQRWRWIDGTISVPMLGMRALAMSVRTQRAWIGTDRGVVRVRLDGDEAMAAWTLVDGLPDDRVFAVSAANNGAWVGTGRGLVWIDDSTDTRNTRTRNISARYLENTTVFALQPVGDTLWIGTSAGLVALTGGTSNGTLVRPLGSEPALRRPIRALTWSDSVLLAVTDDGVLQLTPRRPSPPTRVIALDVQQVGLPTRIFMDDRTVFLAGTQGLIVMNRRDNGLRVLRVPNDLPSNVTDVVASRDWLWIGTAAGLLRMRRAADGGLP